MYHIIKHAHVCTKIHVTWLKGSEEPLARIHAVSEEDFVELQRS